MGRRQGKGPPPRHHARQRKASTLAKRGQGSKDLRELRSLYAKAKKKGLVRGNIDARKLKPTKYMRKKLGELKPYLTDGDYKVVKVDTSIAKRWRDNLNNLVPYVSGKSLIVKADKQTVASVKGGSLVLIKPLKNGEIERVPIPGGPQNFLRLQNWIETSEETKRLKNEDEHWFFRIYGQNSVSPFENLRDMLRHLERYQIAGTRDFAEAFELYRVRGWPPKGTFNTARGIKKPMTISREDMERRRGDFAEKRRERAKRYRKYMSEEQKARVREQKRLAAQRRRMEESDTQREKRLKAQREYFRNAHGVEKDRYRK